jgi:hypothetical protein
MSRTRNTTTAPTGSIAPLGLRLLPSLREQIEDAARAKGRSLNAEVTARLQASFEPSTESLPTLVQLAVEDEIRERGGSVADALTRLVTMGQACGGTLLFATVGPKTTVKQFLKMLDASKTVIPPDTSLVFEPQSSKCNE